MNYFSIILLIASISKVRNWFFLFFFVFLSSNFILVQHTFIITSQLLIGFNSWHPPLFYVSLCCCLLFFFRAEYTLYLSRIRLLFITSITLLLGGYWGLGNSVWGYFWVNDPIELILLLFVSIMVLTIHTTNNNNLIVHLVLILLCGCILLIFLRFGIFFTRHSFFNTKGLTNTIFLLFLSLLFCDIAVMYLVLFFIFCLFFSHFVYYLLLYLVSLGCATLTNSTGKIACAHLVLFASFILWLKVRLLNLIIFRTQIIATAVNIFLTPQSVYFSNFFFLKNILHKIVLYNSLFFIYSSKLLLRFSYIFVVYKYTIWLIIGLVLWFCF